MTIRLVLPIPPSANRYWRSVGGRVYVSAEATAYKEQVGWYCRERQIEPYASTVQIGIDVYRARKSGDLDNFLKVAIDSLRGFCYLDDNQIVEINATRHDDKYNPRIEVLVRDVSPP